MPLTLLLIALVEVGGADDRWVHGLGAGLVAARVLHAQGMWRNPGISFGRRVGTALTMLVLALATAGCLWSGLPFAT